MPAPRDPSTLLAAARLYYLDGKSQHDIAAELGTSRSNVSRMLTEAQRQGIVEIRVHDPAGRSRDLENTLRKRFGLHDVRVAARGAGRLGRAEEQVGTLAAQLLVDSLADSMTIGMSWGHGLQSMVWATPQTGDYSLQVVQLVGGMSSISNEISGHELVRELASRLGASYTFLHSPATFSTTIARDTMLAEPSVAQALALARQADLAFVGIGTPSHGSSAAILSSLDLSADEEKEFWAADPVGDVAARYFTATGAPVLGAVEDHVLGISLAELVEIPNVVGVASGRAKAAGVLGALRGHLIDSLVCDESLARCVLSDDAELTQHTSPTKGVKR
ncbi:MAG: sugar-binding domain-containing protein [Nocardioides sp.]|uniref:sugar-binding transcriptional regulator n=1 Tax=Nocardioides sp. TaxID=35761 RepID=UPI0039E5E14A